MKIEQKNYKGLTQAAYDSPKVKVEEISVHEILLVNSPGKNSPEGYNKIESWAY